MLERLLERISLSEFKDKFILKGGMLVAKIVGVDMKSTIDMDAITEKNLSSFFKDVFLLIDSLISLKKTASFCIIIYPFFKIIYNYIVFLSSRGTLFPV